ncbi:MAG: acyl carrier protein [Actinomycetota bacterium]|nr:acyl carrier protein [Actinomycetota bacterium]
MMDRAKLVAAIDTALSEVLEREVTGLTEDTRAVRGRPALLDVRSGNADGTGGHRRDLGRPGTLDMDDFRSVGTLAGYQDAQQTDSALAAEPSRARRERAL